MSPARQAVTSCRCQLSFASCQLPTIAFGASI
jgi:hypothetical protein